MSDELLEIHAYEEPGRHVLTLRGELDLAGVPAFEEATVQLCQLGARELLVDISEVGFIDSAGVRAILSVKNICNEHSCELSMTHGSEQSEVLFELTRLLERFPFRRARRQEPRVEIELWPSAEGGSDEAAGRAGES
ncbi:MAG: STAS domain-containing protein [Solirubrobacteraceae bacterium]